MAKPFDMFVVFAEMRTGSNFLESNLNAFDGLTCHGEAFNPHFIGYPKSEDILGVSLQEREAKPQRLLRLIRQKGPGLGGFRYFHDHDPRVLLPILEDRRCAKIILTRNPLDSYVSWKIAQQTGQWKLTNVQKRKDAKARFQFDEFEAHVARLQTFQVTLQHALQSTGQTGFYMTYEDLQDLDVINGLARWLGLDEQLDALSKSLKRQNPAAVSEKVENPAELETALSRLDRFNLTRTPQFEPRRGPLLPSYLAGAKTPLIFMPIRSGPEAAVRTWMAALDGVAGDDLDARFNRKTLREWKEARPGHRSFTVLRHPVARAHAAFCSKILPTSAGAMLGIRRSLIRQHGVALPPDGPDETYDSAAHNAAFKGFLRFLRANLAGQTSTRIDNHWASQAACLQGMADFGSPDVIVREDEIGAYLPALAMQVGHPNPPDPVRIPQSAPFSLAEIYDGEIEALAREAYHRDYMLFGFSDWA